LLAAGVPLEEQGSLTGEQTHYHLEAFRERTYWQVRAQMSLILQNVDDKGIDKILSKAPGDPKRGQAMDLLMAPYAPLWRRQKAEGSRALPIPGMTARAATGLVLAAERDLIDHASWLGLVKLWDRVIATSDL
jgi:hypothetical protein